MSSASEDDMLMTLDSYERSNTGNVITRSMARNMLLRAQVAPLATVPAHREVPAQNTGVAIFDN